MKTFIEQNEEIKEIEKRASTQLKNEWEHYFKTYDEIRKYLIENDIEFKNIIITKKEKK